MSKVGRGKSQVRVEGGRYGEGSKGMGGLERVGVSGLGVGWRCRVGDTERGEKEGNGRREGGGGEEQEKRNVRE